MSKSILREKAKEKVVYFSKKNEKSSRNLLLFYNVLKNPMGHALSARRGFFMKSKAISRFSNNLY